MIGELNEYERVDETTEERWARFDNAPPHLRRQWRSGLGLVKRMFWQNAANPDTKFPVDTRYTDEVIPTRPRNRMRQIVRSLT